MAITEFEKLMLDRIDTLTKSQNDLSLSIEQIIGTCNSRTKIVENGEKGLEVLKGLENTVINHENRINTVETNQRPWNNLKTFGVIAFAILTVTVSLMTSWITMKNFTKNVLYEVQTGLTPKVQK